MENFTILIVDDHMLLRNGVRQMIEEHADLTVIGEAADGSSAIATYKRLKPDLVILDLTLPDISGEDVARSLMEYDPMSKIVAFTVHRDLALVHKALNSGFLGYAVKETSSANLIEICRNALNGKMDICQEVMEPILQGFLSTNYKAKNRRYSETLTSRENQIFGMLDLAVSNKEIATALNISVKTVEKHKSNIIEKLNLSSPAELRKIISES